jgi:probable HAF family extracellular repeat protein
MLGTVVHAQHTFTFRTINIPGVVNTKVFGINSSKQIIGIGVDDSGVFHGFLYDNGQPTLLDVPGAQPETTFPIAINDLGQIVGTFEPPSTSTPPTMAFLYDQGVFTTLNLPGGPAGINNLGQIVGEFGGFSNDSLGEQGFLYSGGTVTVIDYPGSLNTMLAGINDAGQIVGTFFDASLSEHGFLYSGGAFTQIDFPGQSSTFLGGINNAGTIIGAYPNNSFEYTGGVFLRVFDPKRGTSFTGATGINNEGEIIGNYSVGNTLATEVLLAVSH